MKFDRVWVRAASVAVLILVLALVAACGGGTTATQQATGANPLPPASIGGAYQGGTATGDTESGAQFARWVLEQDPQRQYITDAVVRNEQTLGVKVNPSVTRADIQRLLEALASGMARTFPGKALTINAFYQSGDKLADASYDPRTNRVDIRFAS